MTHSNTPSSPPINQERMEAILHLAGQIDLQVTELSREMESINLRLESLRAVSTQIFNLRNGTLSDEKVYALVQAGKEAGSGSNSSSAYLLDEIMVEELVTSPE